MRRVFIPNRGEIAVRIVNACHGLGLECVVGASEPDMAGLAAHIADRAVCLGPGPASQSYLRDDVVVHAALSTRCDAIHPGYGFLSESPKLAERAREHGLTFVGPSARALKLAGDKLAAREEAAKAGAPVLPGGEVTDAEEARALAKQIGYPLLVKAAGGGGGRGIKRVDDDDDLDSLTSLARSEAGSAFGDDRVYLEKLIEAARHVEVQIAADEHGTVLHLGERDCTVQRRFQKVVEEAPAPQLTDATRRRLQQAAVAFAERINYRNLGTAEFVIDTATGDPYFLEMNCRIQVEHPVTEAITYLDLVQMQLQIAGGHPLEIGQDDVSYHGHAIECRLNAEDPSHGYRPSPGTLSLFAVPQRDGLRVDTHCQAGTAVPPFYDSLLAKLIGHGSDREHAINILIQTLEDLDVDGVETNRTLLIGILGHPDFRAGPVTTDWLERALR
ncbi:MAG TPA: biotin carboxylase N-terminal domain-containing protein [Solirubrobacteraceae bacterium]|jgi:acetyl-CoA carboxylase biotin carboxylase subunit|nr:biotin carboxylase N-terminal domain-containing protein [Solirubrobacteraceae bacterium]